MPDQRQHRGPHPEDQQLFSTDHWPRLRKATRDLSWLLTRGYASTSALKIVGDRYSLDARQRLAVARCACSDDAKHQRQCKLVTASKLRGKALWIDGYNILISIEAALSGGVILHARDGCYRDMASMHGSYRKVEESAPAIRLLGAVLTELDVESCRWYLDQPVSNSGRLKQMLRELAEEHDWRWEIELVPDPDFVLSQTEKTVASSDSQILDKANRWFDLAKYTINHRVADKWIVDLSDSRASDSSCHG